MELKYIYYIFAGYYAVARASELVNRIGIGNRIIKAPVNKVNTCCYAMLIEIKNEKACDELLNQNCFEYKKGVFQKNNF